MRWRTIVKEKWIQVTLTFLRTFVVPSSLSRNFWKSTYDCSSGLFGRGDTKKNEKKINSSYYWIKPHSNKNTKVKVCYPDGETDYFDIVAGVQQGDTLAPYLFIICLDYMLRTSTDIIEDNYIKLALTDKIEQFFFKQWLCQYCYMDALHGH